MARCCGWRGARAGILGAGMALLLSACGSLPENVERPVSHAMTDTDDTRIARDVLRYEQGHPDESGFVLLSSGLDAFVARAALAGVAERTIDAQYYLLHNDLTGKLFIHQLVKAANRGVRVRLLVDDMDLADRDAGAYALDSHPNMEVRIFNPFHRDASRTLQFVSRLGSVTRRMHNKSFTVDNQVTVVGGRNIGDEYFAANPDLEFGDLDVMAVGPVVKEVSAAFDAYWNNELSYPASALVEEPPSAQEITAGLAELDAFAAEQEDSAYMRALLDSGLAHRLRDGNLEFYWGTSEVVVDSPEKISEDRSREDLHMATQLAPYFDAVDKELIIFSPYFVPGNEGVEFLGGLAARGVRVRILTNSLASNDVGVVHAGYAKYRKPLLRAGVELYELDKKLPRDDRRGGGALGSKASLHAKSFVLDRHDVFIGSMNLDPRSFLENTEIGIMLQSPEMADGMAQWFDENLERVAFRLSLEKGDDGLERIVWHGRSEDGEAVEYLTDPYTSFWRRFGIGLMGILPIESQL